MPAVADMAFDEEQFVGEPPGGDIERFEGAGVVAEGDMRTQPRAAVERLDAASSQPRGDGGVTSANLTAKPPLYTLCPFVSCVNATAPNRRAFLHAESDRASRRVRVGLTVYVDVADSRI